MTNLFFIGPLGGGEILLFLLALIILLLPTIALIIIYVKIFKISSDVSKIKQNMNIR